MTINPLVKIAEIYELLDENAKREQVPYGGIQYACEKILDLRNNETIVTAAARTAYEGQLHLEAFVEEQPETSKVFDAPHLLATMWNAPELLRVVEKRDSLYAVDPSDAKLLRMAASLITMGQSLASPEMKPDFTWLSEILAEILSELDDSSIGKQMKLSIRRQIEQTSLLLEHNPVSADLVIRYLATLSGLLSAAAQAESRPAKARQFMKWSVRIAGGIVIDALTGVPAATITNAILLAIDGTSESNPSDDILDEPEVSVDP